MRRPIATTLAALTLLVVSASGAFAQSTIQLRTSSSADAVAIARTAPSQRATVLRSLDLLREQLAERPPVSVSPRLDATSNPPDDSTQTGGISGYVTIDPLDDGRNTARDAWVLAVATNLSDNPTAWQATSVDDNGRYAFVGLNAGEYILMAGAPNVQSLFYQQARTLSDAEPVPVAPGILTEGINFFLDSVNTGTGSIGGIVLAGNDGTPIAGATVRAYSTDNVYREYSTTTGNSGAYKLENLPSGRYILQASARGYFSLFFDGVTSRDQATPVAVESETVTDGIDFSLRQSGALSGQVTNQDGEPVPWAEVIVVPQHRDSNADSLDWQYSFWTETDSSGKFVASELRAGEYFVRAQAFNGWLVVTEWYDNAKTVAEATPVKVEEGKTTEGIDFELDVAFDSGRISGRVLDADGHPVANAYLFAEPYDSLAYQEPIYSSAWAETNADGYYTFADVPTGSYRVALQYWGDAYYPTMWYDQVFDRSKATPVGVAKDATTDGINFNLVPINGVIEGIITDADGKPVPNANVYAATGNYYYPTDLALWNGGAGWATTDENGAYRITGLIDAEYYVSASACLFWQCVERWWPDGEFFGDAKPVVVKDAQSDPAEVNITLPLKQGSARLSGIVYGTNGQGLAGANVALSLTSDADIYPENPNTDPYFASGDSSIYWNSQAFTTTDSSGAFVFRNLPAGDYTASASFWADAGYAEQWYDGADSRGDATVIRLADGDVREDINFKLELRPLWGSLAGNVLLDKPVVDAAGNVTGDSVAVNRAYVEVSPFYWDLIDSIIAPQPYHAVTGRDGVFKLDGLFQGRYYVSVYAQAARQLNPSDESRYVVDVKGGETTWTTISMTPVDEGPGTIAGSVRSDGADANFNSELEIAVVQAVMDDATVKDPHRTFTAITETDGTYKLTGLPPGEYILWSFAPFHATEYYDDVYDPADAKRIRLGDDPTTSGLEVTGIDLALAPVYYLSDSGGPPANRTSYVFGRVTDETGEPLSDALVYALDDAGTVVQSSRSHSDGMYEMGFASGNKIRIKATRAGYTSRFHDGAESFDASSATVLGSGRFEINISLQAGSSIGVDGDRDELPTGITLSGNYPNPFAEATQIGFSLSDPMAVTVTVFDALGREVAEIYRGTLSAGEQLLQWDARGADGASVTSGMYFYRIAGGGGDVSASLHSVRTGRMMVLR